jgi:hypothetical protein
MGSTADVWKVGVTKTPYSAVRGRQKYTWSKFGLTDLYFGDPSDIAWLEQQVKDDFKYCSGKTLQGYGTELFKINIDVLKKFIAHLTEEHDLRVRPVTMNQPYTAASSGQCPFKIPGEKDADWYLEKKCDEIFGTKPYRKTVNVRNTFNKLYKYE